MTSMTSIPPKAEQRFAISFENDTRFAKRAFEAYLMSSAVRVFVRMRGTEAKGRSQFFESVEGPGVVPA